MQRIPPLGISNLHSVLVLSTQLGGMCFYSSDTFLTESGDFKRPMENFCPAHSCHSDSTLGCDQTQVVSRQAALCWHEWHEKVMWSAPTLATAKADSEERSQYWNPSW